MPRRLPSHPMPLPGAPPPDKPDETTHQPVEPDDGQSTSPIAQDQEDADWQPPPGPTQTPHGGRPRASAGA
jgi:hypothetical protein